MPWSNWPVPGYTTSVRHLHTMPEDWMNSVLADTARRCVKGAGEAACPPSADNSAAEATRYEYVERPNREERSLIETRQKTYWKCHMAAILGLQIVPVALTAPGRFAARSVVYVRSCHT